MGAIGSARILLIDEDAALLGLLQSLLEEAGCAVETVVGLEGFTPELMSLAQPHVVFLNPHLRGMNPTLLRGILQHFRKLQPRAALILIGHRPSAELEREAAELGIERCVPTASLLRNPVGELPGPTPVPSPAAPAPRLLGPAELSPEDILELELGLPQAPPVPPPLASRKPPPGVSLAPALTRLIEEEVLAAEDLEAVDRFEVALDVLTENNLYGPERGQVRGVFVATSVRPKVGATVDLVVRFPWGTSYEIEGTVEWAQDLPRLAKRSRGGFGVLLPELTPLQKSMFERFANLRHPLLIGAGWHGAA